MSEQDTHEVVVQLLPPSRRDRIEQPVGDLLGQLMQTQFTASFSRTLA